MDERSALPFEEIGSRQFRIACEAAGIGVWEWNIQTGVMRYSDIARSIMGFTRCEHLMLETVRSVTHPDDLPKTQQAASEALDPAVRARPVFTYRILRHDTGEERWVRAHGHAEFAIIDGQEQATLYTGSIQDITDLEKAQTALKESEARLNVALSAADMAVWEVDVEQNKITTSPDLNRLYEFPEDSAPTTDDFRARYAPGEAERFSREGGAAFASGAKMFQTRLLHILPSGKRTFTVRAAFAPEGASDRRRVVGVVYDVSEQVRQEARLEAIAQELRHRMKNMATLIGVIAGRMWPKDATYHNFIGRLRAMSAAADLMFGEKDRALSLHALLDKIVEPFRATGFDPFTLSGPSVMIPDKLASDLALAMHELATNAVKHGALRDASGQISIRWTVDGQGSVDIVWQESGGEPIQPPSHTSFGMILLTNGALSSPHTVDVQFPEEGLIARFHLVLDTAPSLQGRV